MKKIIFIMLIMVSVIFGACAKTSPDTAQKSEQGKSSSPAIDFKLQNLKGENIKLSDYKGKVVVMNFFATWCPPCKAELPGFMNMKDKYRDKNVVFLFVDVQEPLETVRNFVDSRGYTDMDPLLDSEGSVSNKYNIRGIPKTYILDTKGNIIFSNEGYLEETALKAAVDSALEQK